VVQRIIIQYLSNFPTQYALLEKFGAVHKRRPYKIVKNWSPSPRCPQNVRTGSTPLVRADTL